MKTSNIDLPRVVTRAEWLVARKELLAEEKELTHRRDALNAERRKLPMVRIEKDYIFEGPEGEQPFDLPGLSCFLRDGDMVFHTYSTYGRGGETVGGAYYFLDLTALGRQEDWEEPKGRATGLGAPAGSDRIHPLPRYEE